MARNKYSIVVAEDEELLLHNLVSKIENTGLEFEIAGTAQTGLQALALVKEMTPDLLITDIRMPELDGIGLLEKVRERFPLMKLFIISGFSEFEYARSAISLNVSDYLLKPIDPDELYQALLKVQNSLRTEQSSYLDIFNEEMNRQPPEQIASTLRDFILTNFYTDINLNLIANNMHYSASYLTKIFLQQYNTTPSKYIITLRMQKAQQLLSHTPGMSIRQIGEAVGYHEQGYFSRIFKKNVGLSPLDYRAKEEG